MKFPENVVQKLQQEGLTGDSSLWSFRALELSGERAYIDFGWGRSGFEVVDNAWTARSMAEAVKEEKDFRVFDTHVLPLQDIGVSSQVHVFRDGSLYWVDSKGETHTTKYSTGESKNLLTAWIESMQKKERSWWFGLTGRRGLMIQMRLGLQRLLGMWNERAV